MISLSAVRTIPSSKVRKKVKRFFSSHQWFFRGFFSAFPAVSLPMTQYQSKDSVDKAHISLQVQVTAKNLAALRKVGEEKLETFKQSLEMFKEDLEDEDLT
jgi:hypothetical protein